VAMEGTAFLLLLPFGVRMLRKGFCRIGALVLVVMLLAAFAKFNHFALADSTHSHLDMLFSLVMLLEMVAGIAFYVRSARVKSGCALDAFSGFAHFMLPLQQALPTYFRSSPSLRLSKWSPAWLGKAGRLSCCKQGG